MEAVTTQLAPICRDSVMAPIVYDSSKQHELHCCSVDNSSGMSLRGLPFAVTIIEMTVTKL